MHNAFLETDYVVHQNDKIKRDIVLKIGQAPDEIYSEIGTLKSWAFITAWNPLPTVFSLSENRIRNKELKEILKKQGYTFHEGVGISSDQKWSEESLLIENIDEISANEIASKFGQLAFVYCGIDHEVQLIYSKGL